jgi:hypothetical protein
MDVVVEPLRHVLRGALRDKPDERPSPKQFGDQLRQVIERLHPERGGTAALARSLTFPNGADATSRTELAALCVKHWDYASDILYDGSIAYWLRDALHDPVAAQTAEQAVVKYGDDPRAGLEYLVRTLDPKAMPAPRVTVAPTGIDLGTAARRTLFTDRASFQVTNRGAGRADCQIREAPSWLFLDPQRFICQPGQTLVVEMVGRVDLLPAEGTTHNAVLQVDVEGGRTHQVRVTVRKGKQKGKQSTAGAYAAIAFASLVLLGAITWFVIWVLPKLP